MRLAGPAEPGAWVHSLYTNATAFLRLSEVAGKPQTGEAGRGPGGWLVSQGPWGSRVPAFQVFLGLGDLPGGHTVSPELG